MNSDKREGHPNTDDEYDKLQELIYLGRETAYGYTWDFKSGRRVSYDARSGKLEVNYTDKGVPLEGYPKVMGEEELQQLLRAVLQLEGSLTKMLTTKVRDLLFEIDGAVQDGLTVVTNTKDAEVDEALLDPIKDKVLKLNKLLGILEPKMPAVLPMPAAKSVARPGKTTAQVATELIAKAQERKDAPPAFTRIRSFDSLRGK